MAVDMFIKIGDVKGEAKDDKHKDEIEIESFSWGATQAGTFAFGGGGGAGKVRFQDLHFSTGVSKASPLLFKACATGQHYKEAILTCRKAGGSRESLDFMKITLSDVLVTSYQAGGSSGGDRPTESLSLNYAKIEYEVAAQNPDGSLGDANKAGWDLKANKAI